MVEKSNFITRFLDKIDALVPEKSANVEARRIEEAKRSLKGRIDNFSRKDIPKMLGILSQDMVERSPNQVFATIDGKKILIEGIDGNENSVLKVTVDGEENIVHNPHLVGDILIRESDNRK